ncbi:PQQ-like domain-containing protein [Neorhodopirellula lusitana]|uniref:PQQ-like domain-containing protein n=1 Tax=Neorhodopirellula lusitana TaxID=445327 RepID=A0ABY1Q3E6_9BACT|nr:PQQ-binding-like beta-propeller repeat protein [Neorhodopirellula lusitana]SMP58155.1 PQQ-like domain-containing protein [Neorhodopirellula lusitana]
MITSAKLLSRYASLMGAFWLLGALWLNSQLLAESPEWPRFLNDDFSGSVDLDPEQATPSTLSWNQPPKIAWALDLGDGYGLGVIRNDAYFHFDSVHGKERLRKVSLDQGEVLWTQTNEVTYRDMYGYEPGPRCSPTSDGDDIFTLGVSGTLTARSIQDGQQRWQVQTNDAYQVVQNFFGVGSSPLVLDDLVIVMVGGSPAADQAIAPGRLDRVSPNGSLAVAFDRNSGEERWRCGDDLASYSSPRTITLGNEVYVLMLARDHLHVIDPRKGKSIGQMRFRADILESVNAMTPVVRDNRVLIGDCYDSGAVLLEIDVQDDKAIFRDVWRDPAGNRRAQALRSHMSTPVLQDGYIYGCSGRNAPDSDFRCVEFLTGDVQWTALSRRRTNATRFGDVLLVLKETGPLHIVRCTPQSFDELAVWKLDEAIGDHAGLGYPCWAAPIVSGRKMLVRGDQNLFCLEIPED